MALCAVACGASGSLGDKRCVFGVVTCMRDLRGVGTKARGCVPPLTYVDLFRGAPAESPSASPPNRNQTETACWPILAGRRALLLRLRLSLGVGGRLKNVDTQPQSLDSSARLLEGLLVLVALQFGGRGAGLWRGKTRRGELVGACRGAAGLHSGSGCQPASRKGFVSEASQLACAAIARRCAARSSSRTARSQLTSAHSSAWLRPLTAPSLSPTASATAGSAAAAGGSRPGSTTSAAASCSASSSAWLSLPAAVVAEASPLRLSPLGPPLPRTPHPLPPPPPPPPPSAPQPASPPLL